MNDPQTQLQAAKDRLSIAAARCLAGDRTAIAEADEAMAETERLRRETQLKHVSMQRQGEV